MRPISISVRLCHLKQLSHCTDGEVQRENLCTKWTTKYKSAGNGIWIRWEEHWVARRKQGLWFWLHPRHTRYAQPVALPGWAVGSSLKWPHRVWAKLRSLTALMVWPSHPPASRQDITHTAQDWRLSFHLYKNPQRRRPGEPRGWHMSSVTILMMFPENTEAACLWAECIIV